MKVSLYTTAGCHLCEEAAGLLRQAQAAGHAIDICEVDIADSESLTEAYGIRIPVVGHASRELGWPFTFEDLERFITNPE